MPRKRKPLTSFPIRQCKSLHQCAVCLEDITLGQLYYDGGYGRRTHFDGCGLQAEKDPSAEHSQGEQDRALD